MIVGIVGATGAVGQEIIALLSELKFPVTRLRLFASERSSGKELSTPFGVIKIEAFTEEEAGQTQVLFLAVSGEFAKTHARRLAAIPGGPIVIDNSSALRMEPDVPLIVPEINGHLLFPSSSSATDFQQPRLIANPNCTTAIAVMALWPIYVKFGIKSLIVSSYQAASGAGAEGMIELVEQARQVVAGIPEKEYGNGALDLATLKTSIFAYPLAFNIIPQIDVFQENGYTKEEMKVTWETCKIFGDNSMKISCTAVRIPTMRAHSEALTVETVLPVTPEEAREVIAQAEGVVIVDDPSKKKYPMPLTATRRYEVEAGRIRQSLVYGKKGLDIFVSGDQLFRGAALNAIYIAQMAISNKPVTLKKFKAPILALVSNATIKAPVAGVLVLTAALAGFILSGFLRRF